MSPTRFSAAALRVWGGALLLAVLLFPAAARAELIYDNSQNSLNTFLSRTEEFGDEVSFAGTARVVTAMAFQVFGERDVGNGVTAVFRLYRNNGPVPPRPKPQVPTPGDLLYQSPEIPVHAGVQPIQIRDLEVPVPAVVIWTVEFRGMSGLTGERVGLQVYHPPVIGGSFRDYWVRDTSGFQLYVLDNLSPASFAARFEAQPDPPVFFTTARGLGGRTQLTITGPFGSEQVIEYSRDQQAWITLGTLHLARTNVATFLAPPEAGGTTNNYRLRPFPHPGQSVLLRSIIRLAGNSTQLMFTGPTNSEHFLEVSADQRSWRPLQVISFAATNRIVVVDPDTTPGSRFYRTTRPATSGPVFLIKGIERRPDGSAVVTFNGAVSDRLLSVQATADFVTWDEVGTLRFILPQMQFTDRTAEQTGHRFYRLAERRAQD